MSSAQFEISEALGQLHEIANAGYALGFHIEYTTPKFVFQTYPKAWLDYYSSNGLIMNDPMVAWGFENTGNQKWSDLEDPAGVLEKATEYGMKFGVVIAVASGDSRSIGGFAHPDREFTPEEVAQIEAITTRIHENTAETARLEDETVEQLKKMSVMVTHPGS
ncbi:LuxR family transcriptional regulator [Yoonia maricola]|uniref:LuxR family transcriptional regulator n=1 Tax=Yoonia maricola TaxID=420999 RepID=A0A2M8WMV2_9RHOB|nr:autoinducer binding domain-containing protein [Yoonia maricola]PJI92186.1 LuxR family transcriptional regulator [Yoonia maricola]